MSVALLPCPVTEPHHYEPAAADAPTVTDFFCGAGGSSEGLRQAGFRLRIACNHDPVSKLTHQWNHPGVEHRLANLAETDFTQLPSTSVLWASPSCVWHSRAGGRKRPSAADRVQELRRDDAGSLDRATAFAVIAAAEVHLYPVIIIENVVEFCDWILFDWWLDGLLALGYTAQLGIYDAADFGHAQNRRRWIGVFTQPGIHIDLTPQTLAPVYAAAILDPDPGELVTRPMYITPQIQQITEPGVVHLATYRNHARALRADTHRLPTVTAGGNHHARVVLDEDGRAWQRLLRHRECARAQGFPDTYRFATLRDARRELGPDVQSIGSTRDVVKRQIGNAVPVGLARWLGTRAAAGLAASAAAA
ncbi:DNA cytosine methyltransferase [Nocardia fluminea]|uniref:DNA cytosine methyltransferase n=1 Tax=Nocardia fluminea TaxID=134984 RepID=UPI003654A794